jgi:hypothetical protein
MLKYPCLVLDHDDTVVQSEATVHYPCFEEFLKIYRPGTIYTLADYVRDCGIMSFVDLCRVRFEMTEKELQEEYHFWKNYVQTHIPLAFPGIKELLETLCHTCPQAIYIPRNKSHITSIMVTALQCWAKLYHTAQSYQVVPLYLLHHPEYRTRSEFELLFRR